MSLTANLEEVATTYARDVEDSKLQRLHWSAVEAGPTLRA